VRPLAAALLLLLGACGKDGPKTATAAETPEYRAWKGSQALRNLPAANSAETIAVTVIVHFPQSRSRSPEDFIELYVNGQMAQRVRGKPAGTGPVVPTTVFLTILQGPGWLDVWDSTTNANYRFTIDTRQGKDYVFTPTATGYDLAWTPREN